MKTTTGGKELEKFVAFIEGTLLPEGFSVEINKKVFGEFGQEAEFDVVVSGQLGSTLIQWLIECRDRPSAGAADAAWIEQLVGRRERFNFNKVTAVSTTGFSPAAQKYAKEKGIEIREIQDADPTELSRWLKAPSIRYRRRKTKLLHAELLISEDSSAHIREAIARYVASTMTDGRLLCWSRDTSRSTLNEAFFALVQENAQWFDQVVPGTTYGIHVFARYDFLENKLCVETDIGMVAIPSIEFRGELSIEVSNASVTATHDYRQTHAESAISQTAIFEPQEILGMSMALVLHHVNSTGETHVTMRRIA